MHAWPTERWDRRLGRKKGKAPLLGFQPSPCWLGQFQAEALSDSVVTCPAWTQNFCFLQIWRSFSENQQIWTLRIRHVIVCCLQVRAIVMHESTSGFEGMRRQRHEVMRLKRHDVTSLNRRVGEQLEEWNASATCIESIHERGWKKQGVLCATENKLPS